jgi:lysophospholipase L1-like esterase
MTLVIAALAMLCVFFPREGIMLGDITLRFPSLHKILVKKEKPSLEDIMRTEAYQAQQKALNSLQDSIDFLQVQADSSKLRFWFPQDRTDFFDPLFAAMEQAVPEGRVVRIVHYGDSQIESDRMTQQLRTYMQQHFGGGGPGMQPSLQPIPTYTVSQSTSGAWSRQASYGIDSLTHRSNGNYGPLARCAHLVGAGNISFRAGRQSFLDDRVRHFNSISVIFNNRPGPLSVTLSCAAGLASTSPSSSWTVEEDAPGIHAISWKLDKSVGSANLNMTGDADVYSILVDDGPGVSVDNVPLRGCSGQQFTMINKDQLTAAFAQMHVALIILQFGGNSVPYLTGRKSVEIYARDMGRQIDRMRQVCPGAKVLFVGPSDMSTNIDGEMQSFPFLPSVVSILRDTALAHGAAYWSIYDAMGGHNSMATWVDNGLAGTDYVHFSPKGARIIGERFAEAFDKMYKIYLLRKRKQQTVSDTTFASAETGKKR